MITSSSYSRGIAFMAIAAALVTTEGCSKLPAVAPTTAQIEHQEASADSQYFAIVDVDDNVAKYLVDAPDQFAGRFKSGGGASRLKIARGDVLQISILEVGGGLFGQTNNAATLGPEYTSAEKTSLQPIVVADDGFVNVPYAGRIRAAGKTPDGLRQDIEQLLSKKAASPQIQISVVGSSDNTATVGGDVNRPAVLPLAVSGTRLLDAISTAGGSRFAPYETTVRITRGTRTQTASLGNIVRLPSNNIYIYPRDTIYLTREPHTFSAIGASGKVGHYPFDAEQLMLAEALGKSGGFVNATSDIAGAYLFRFDRVSFVKRLNHKIEGPADALIPCIYHFDFRGGKGFFYAQHVPVHDKDIVMVAESEAAQLLKFFTLVRGVTGIVNDLRSTGGATTATGAF